MNATKTKHTPGPWNVQPDPEFADVHPHHQSRFITSGKLPLSHEDWGSDPDCKIICSLRDCENQSANARLIAAAPELLAALQLALDSGDFGTPTQDAGIKQIIHAAIAKATA